VELCSSLAPKATTSVLSYIGFRVKAHSSGDSSTASNYSLLAITGSRRPPFRRAELAGPSPPEGPIGPPRACWVPKTAFQILVTDSGSDVHSSRDGPTVVAVAH